MTGAVSLTLAPIDPAAQLARFTAMAAGAGAIVSFTGLARATGGDGAPLEALVLESYRGVTLASMEAIMADARRRFAISHAEVIHRHGRIPVEEPVVFVATAAAHRRAAFAAADYLMDRLKTEAVFWKREDGPGGSRWIEPSDADHHAAARWMAGED